MYKVDTHVHTSESSPCASISGAEVARRYHKLGYTSFVVTDHIHESFFTRPSTTKSAPTSDMWDAFVDEFLKGYNAAKIAGDKLGINVILGAEIRFKGINSDFLLYGLDEDFLRKNKYLHEMCPTEFAAKFGNDLLIIQAHPFRDYNERKFIRIAHGIEVFNGHPRHNNHNDLARDYRDRNPTLYALCGSDAHDDGDEGRAVMYSTVPLKDSYGLKNALVSGNIALYP
ncbi:MAG: PHP domain-containing protein [Defluviitaleaceae bacterium]|nr:PHP domain-containing protein [Defluviitaleaceae bacterium]